MAKRRSASASMTGSQPGFFTSRWDELLHRYSSDLRAFLHPLPVSKDVANGEVGVDARDAGEDGEYVLVDTLEVVRVGDIDPQQIVRDPSHQIALADLRIFADRGLEASEVFLRLAF